MNPDAIIKLTPGEEHWTIDRLKEELYLHLMNVTERNEKNGSAKRKYLAQARHLIYKIPVYRPIPSFDVSVGDLSDELRIELHNLDSESLDDVLKEAIGRIFENINQRYYLLSVKKLLKWKLVG